MFNLQKLSLKQKKLCYKTISANTFYLLVGNAISTHIPLSVVRMADGEQHFLNSCKIGKSTDLAIPPPGHDEAWMDTMGCKGVSMKGKLFFLIGLARSGKSTIVRKNEI